MSERTRNSRVKISVRLFTGEFASEEGKEVTGRSVQACDTFEINHNETRFASDFSDVSYDDLRGTEGELPL